MALNIEGVDYAWGTPPYDALKRAGYRFAMRYVSHDAGKDLTAGEKQELWKRRIAVGLVFESTSGRALQGYDAGLADAEFADQRAKSLGLAGIPIYFAVDFDATDAQKPAVAKYLLGAAKAIGHPRVGVYGGFFVVKYMHERAVCSWFWQTLAWSGGQVHSATHIYQHRNDVTVGGLSCDLNRASVQGLGSLRGPVKRPSPAYIAYLKGRLKFRTAQLGKIETRRRTVIHRINVLKKKLRERGVSL